MVATYTAHHMLARSKRYLAEFDPDSGSDALVAIDPANSLSLVPIAQFKRFLAGYITSVGTGGITAFSIVAAPASNTAVGSCTTVVTHALGSNPDAVNDHLWLECDVDQVHEVLATATHVGILINLVTSTDEGIAFLECAEPMFPQSALTADYVSA
jgi:hypothetical protein